MTVQTTTSRADYTGNGVTTAFTVPFYFLDNTHLKVLRTQISTGITTTLALTTDYTVSGAGVGSGGTVTCVTAPTSDQRLSILRNIPLTQLLHYVPNDPFPAASHEQALDQLTMEVQQLNEVQARSLTLGPASYGVSTALPTPQGSRFIGWDASGSYLINYDASTVGAVLSSVPSYTLTFSGNGTSTTFDLGAYPGTNANTDVFISGVRQRPTLDYNVVATTVVFTSAPPSGTSNILVKWASALGADGLTAIANTATSAASAAATSASNAATSASSASGSASTASTAATNASSSASSASTSASTASTAATNASSSATAASGSASTASTAATNASSSASTASTAATNASTSATNAASSASSASTSATTASTAATNASNSATAAATSATNAAASATAAAASVASSLPLAGGAMTGGLREAKQTVSASAIDINTGNYFTKTISGTTTFTVSNTPSTGTAASFILDLTNGGSATVNWWSGMKWAGGTAPTLTSAGRDVLGFFTHDGGTTWTGLVLGKDVK